MFTTLFINFSDIFDRCKNAICNFRVRDFIEILILAGIIFITFHLFKGRKAGALLVGLVILAGISVLSRPDVLDLSVLYSLSNTILDSGIIVIIVVFQPEIRDALEKLGNGSIRGIMSFSDRKKKKEQYVNAIENICSAVNELSKSSTGALIVVERSIRLSDVIKMGVTIDANVNDLLLRNLFYDKSPLHDGAVVISGDKIVAAGCFLPLTQRVDLDSSLGTRHRAAIGMAERSDAVVIVVSEETGNISICVDGELLHGFNQKSLRKELNKLLLPNNTKKTPNKNKNQKENQKED